jgi:hypothetical protein
VDEGCGLAGERQEVAEVAFAGGGADLRAQALGGGECCRRIGVPPVDEGGPLGAGAYAPCAHHRTGAFAKRIS